MPGAAWLSVRGVRTGSAAENGTSHRSLAGVEAVSLRQNRSKSSAPRLVLSVVRSQPASTPQAAETSTAPPSLAVAVAVPPGRAAHLRRVRRRQITGRHPVRELPLLQAATVSRPLAAIADTSSTAPRVRSERGVATLPQIRS